MVLYQKTKGQKKKKHSKVLVFWKDGLLLEVTDLCVFRSAQVNIGPKYGVFGSV